MINRPNCLKITKKGQNSPFFGAFFYGIFQWLLLCKKAAKKGRKRGFFSIFFNHFSLHFS